jgi:hypothetical protein
MLKKLEHGVAEVSAGSESDQATVLLDLADASRLVSAGMKIGLTWSHGKRYPYTGGVRTPRVSLAQFILGEGRRAQYLDGNPLNCTRANLLVKSVSAKVCCHEQERDAIAACYDDALAKIEDLRAQLRAKRSVIRQMQDDAA